MNLDDFTLLDIFDNLQLEDLLNIAETHGRFHNLLTDRYMNSKFRFPHSIVHFRKNPPKDSITLTNPNTIFQFLRIFGHLIKKMEFMAGHYSAGDVEDIMEQVGNYCSGTLIEMRFVEAGNYVISRPSQIFTNTKKLEIQHALNLKGQRIAQVYPALEDLSIGMYNEELRSQEEIDQYEWSIRDLLSSLPNLRALHLNVICSYNLLCNIAQKLPALEILKIELPRSFIIPIQNQPAIHFKNVKSLELLYRVEGDAFASLPFTFDALETLKISKNYLTHFPWGLIEQNVGLKRLLLPWLGTHDILSILNRFNDTHNFEEVEIKWVDTVRGEDTVNLFYQFRSLQKITFIIWKTSEASEQRDVLLALMPNEWQVTDERETDYFTFTMLHITVTRSENLNLL